MNCRHSDGRQALHLLGRQAPLCRLSRLAALERHIQGTPHVQAVRRVIDVFRLQRTRKLVGTVFLVGFVPQYVKAVRLEGELRQSRQEAAGAEIRDLIGLAYVQASQKNYGLAAETSSRFFNRVRE